MAHYEVVPFLYQIDRGVMIMQESTFNLQNVKCAGCVSKIQTKVGSLNGVLSAQVNLLDKTMLVRYVNEKIDKLVISSVESIGFGASLDKIEDSKINLWFSVVVPMTMALILMSLTMIPQFMLDFRTTNGFFGGLVYALISLGILVLSGYKVVRSGYIGFKTLAFNMHSLILLGISSAWIYSLVVVLVSYYSNYSVMPHIYFDSSLMIIALINLGAYLEDRAKSNTTNAIKGLANLVPDTATIIVNGEEQIIASNLLRTEYLVKIKPGGQVPSDGEIISGNGYLNESMLTGEPIPIHKKTGDKVIGGSVNTSGAFIYKVTGIGDNTLLSGIINLVKNAQLSKPSLAKLADNIAKVFVPSIIIIAIISGFTWYFLTPYFKFYHAITIFMTILLIACPCSVGLAIPVSLMVGVGRGATKGILIRDPSCLSIADKIDMVLLDKTGTITEGKPQVISAVLANDNHKQYLFKVLTALESQSEHPLAKAILEFCEADTSDVQIQDFKSISGRGVSAIIDGKLYFAGSKDWILELELNHNNLITDSIHSQIYLANSTEVIACFDIADKIKSDSIEAISQLKSLGLQVVMLTGDNQIAANDIAKRVGINEVFANCKPADKIDKVIELQNLGHKVIFVGDGINDAPSLAQADIGIAIGGGTDIARQSAAISLMRESTIGVFDAIILAKKINHNMRQNLFGSFIYNSLAVLVAAGILYPVCGVLLNPMIASIVMSISSLSVIGNALRLKTS